MEFIKESGLMVLLPELTLSISALILLIIGVFSSNKGVSKLISYCAFAISILCAYLVMQTDHGLAFKDMFLSNSFTGFAKVIISLNIAFLALLIAGIANHKKYISFEFPVVLMLSATGMCFLVSSNSLLALYMSLELVTLPLYVLVASNRDNLSSSEAGLKYFILGSVASGLYLFGASLIYGSTGELTFSGIAQYLTSDNTTDETIIIPFMVLMGLILVIAAFCFKVSAAPFHMWAPDVYHGAPTITTTILTTAPKVAALALFSRLFYQSFIELADQWSQVLLIAAVMSMVIGSVAAVVQHNIKRLMAYGSIAHMGFILVGVAMQDASGVRDSFSYLIIYLIMTLGVFAIILSLIGRTGERTEIKNLAGLSKEQPMLAASMAVLMFSMAGIPPLAGFFAKFYILSSLIQKNMFMIAIVGVLSSAIAAYYYLRVIKVMYFEEANEKITKLPSLEVSLIIACTVLINLLYALAPSLLPLIVEQALI